MSYSHTQYAEHIDRVELTPPASRTLEHQEMRRLSLVMTVMALLLCLCVAASGQITEAFQAAYVQQAMAFQSFFLW